jgi:hypothetical protein
MWATFMVGWLWGCFVGSGRVLVRTGGHIGVNSLSQLYLCRHQKRTSKRTKKNWFERKRDAVISKKNASILKREIEQINFKAMAQQTIQPNCYV